MTLSCIDIPKLSIEWMFLKSHNDKIERHWDTLTFDEFEVPTVESLKRIAGKMYAMLSDE